MSFIAALVPITEEQHDVRLQLAYATDDNFTGKPVYRNALCYLHPDAEKALAKAARSARQAGYYLKVFDAYRPGEAQQILFDIAQDPTFVADPKRGSHHTRGCAVDVTLNAAAPAQRRGQSGHGLRPRWGCPQARHGSARRAAHRPAVSTTRW